MPSPGEEPWQTISRSHPRSMRRPEAGSTAPKPPNPDEHPKPAETEAQPDKPVPNQDDDL